MLILLLIKTILLFHIAIESIIIGNNISNATNNDECLEKFVTNALKSHTKTTSVITIADENVYDGNIFIPKTVIKSARLQLCKNIPAGFTKNTQTLLYVNKITQTTIDWLAAQMGESKYLIIANQFSDLITILFERTWLSGLTELVVAVKNDTALVVYSRQPLDGNKHIKITTDYCQQQDNRTSQMPIQLYLPGSSISCAKRFLNVAYVNDSPFVINVTSRINPGLMVMLINTVA